jgi:hypothetical protein
VIDLYEELLAITSALAAQQIDYAVCGGLAMAIHSMPRNTIDIDLLVRAEDAERVEELAFRMGYEFQARPMSFYDGAIKIRRVTKIDPETHDPLMLDLLLVTPAIEDVFANRQELRLENAAIQVVSREGLIKLKSFRSSGRDLDDIRLLRGEEQ